MTVLAAALALAALLQGAPVYGQAPDSIAAVIGFQTVWNAERTGAAEAAFGAGALVSDSGLGGAPRPAAEWVQRRYAERLQIISATEYRQAGGQVIWQVRLSTFTTRTLGAPPTSATAVARVEDGKIAGLILELDPASVTAQRLGVREALARRAQRAEANDPAIGRAVAALSPATAASTPAPERLGAPPMARWAAALMAMAAVVAVACVARPRQMD